MGLRSKISGSVMIEACILPLTVIARVSGDELPQLLEAVTSMLPLLALDEELTVIWSVPCPDSMLNPEGTVQFRSKPAGFEML